MLFSAQYALAQARTSIEEARKARGSENKVMEHYRAAKNTLAKVDTTKADDVALSEMIAALQDLAAVLDNSGEHLNERAAKCRYRANRLMKTLAGRMPIHATSSGLQSLPYYQSTISVSAYSASLFFSKDVNLKPFVCKLPGLGEPLEDTRQLACCLALFRDLFQENSIPLDALEWRRIALSNSKEKRRLESLSIQVIEMFTKDDMKGSAAVAEVIHLAPILEGEYSRSLLTAFIDAINNSEILHLHSLEGLADVIRGTAPGSINSNDLVAILRSLLKKLESTHSGNHHNHYLLVAVSRVLDAMVDASVGDVDRVKLYEPLTDLLRKSESSKNPYLTFQAAYATQALLNVSDDESIWHAGYRQVWLMLKGGAGFAKMADPTEIKDALEGLERLYEAGKGGVRLFKNVKQAIKHHELPTFTKEEGLRFKRAWYRALRTAETYIQAGELLKFNDLAATASCRNHPMFQWGICQLLGAFATDTQWNLKTRQEALGFLGSFSKDNGMWERHKEVDQVIFDVLTNLTSKNMCFEVANSTLEEMGKQIPALKPIAGLQSPLWDSVRSADQTKCTTPKGTLLKAIQDKNIRHANLKNMPALPTESSLNEVHSALEFYHEPDLFILRVSGQKLDLETCYVNLAIVEAPENRDKEKEELKEQAAVFHRIPCFEKVKNTNTQDLIPVEQLFSKRLRHETEITPKRILVQGRAGIGKSTLCKKLVHTYQRGLWRDLFDAVLWLPLRQLRGSKSRTLEGLFREKIFTTQGFDREQSALANALAIRAQKGKVLFILDGLDEIATDTGSEENKTFRSFLKALLSQQYVVITSRPSGVDGSLLPPIDLELETVGFSQENVKNFVAKVLEEKAARTVQDFIQKTPLIQGLVNIPVQLDVICFSWDSLPKDGGPALTMTGLYQLMVWKLWCKDAVRLKKAAGGQSLTEEDIHKLKAKRIDGLMATEVQHLGYLAFKGMNNHHQIEFDENALLQAFEDLEELDNGRLSAPQLVKVMKQTSFLHTADADLNSNNDDSQQAWHFLHLTFQEYFAATWIVRHFHPKQPSLSPGMMTMEEVTEFVHQHKYNPQYEIVWSMVAGLLEGEPLRVFFGLLQGEPRDLIGGRHQQILASCLHEARTRLDPAFLLDLDTELMDWLRFEMKMCKHGKHDKSMLGSQVSFPDIILMEVLGSFPYWKITLLNTLAARSVLSNSATQFLMTTLMNEDADARSLAAQALGKQSTLPESTIRSLIVALKYEAKSLGSAAASVLAKQSTLPEAAIQLLITFLKDEDKFVGCAAASVLAKKSTLPESAIQLLTAALKDEDEFVRSSAADILGKQSTLQESAVLSLIALLKHSYWRVRSSSASILNQRSTLPEMAILSLIAALKDENRFVRSSAASALGKQVTLPESAIQSLIAAIKDEDGFVRYSAASALGKQCALPEPATQFLIAAPKDFDVRSSSILASSKQYSAIQSHITILKHEEKNVGDSAVSSLSKQSTLRESIIQPLISGLTGNQVILSAVEALGKRPTLPPSSIQFLIDALNIRSSKVRIVASEVLGKQSTLSESGSQFLIAALRDKYANVRISAAEALGRHPKLAELAIQSLTAALKDYNENVKSSSAEALGKQSSLPESVIQSLISALKDKYRSVRFSAAEALGNQSTLSESAIHSLIDALKVRKAGVKPFVSETLQKQFHSLCTSLPYLTESEVACLYENHLFLYSCSHVLSLQVQSGVMCLYTERGVMHVDLVDGDWEENFLSAVRDVQHKACLRSQHLCVVPLQ